jgi:hypothetical protein
MNGARFVHDELVGQGWEVLIADAQRVKGLAPLACLRDRRHRPLRFARQADRLHRPLPARQTIRRLRSARPALKARAPLPALGLIEAAIHAAPHPLYRERYQRTKRRLGRQRGAKVAQIDLARKLTEAIWYMLTRNQPFAPAGATFRLTA